MSLDTAKLSVIILSVDTLSVVILSVVAPLLFSWLSKGEESFGLADNACKILSQTREYYRGKYHRTLDLLFDWFGLVCFVNKNINYELSYSLLQTSQTGGQWYSNTSPFSIPWPN